MTYNTTESRRLAKRWQDYPTNPAIAELADHLLAALDREAESKRKYTELACAVWCVTEDELLDDEREHQETVTEATEDARDAVLCKAELQRLKRRIERLATVIADRKIEYDGNVWRTYLGVGDYEERTLYELIHKLGEASE